MRSLPQHRTLLVILAFLVLGAGISYWFSVRPLRSRITKNRTDLARDRTSLQRTGYPLDSTLLAEEIKLLRKRIDGAEGEPGIKETSQLVLTNATRMFMGRIVKEYQTQDTFRRHARRSSFQADFSRVSLKLADRETYLAPAVLGISDESSSPYIYQLILQIWTAERLADLAHQEGLTVAAVSGVEVDHDGKKVQASDLRLLPVRGYILKEKDTFPYLIEFPVQATLVGELDQVKSLLRKLTSRGNFLPATHVEIYGDDPDLPAYHQGRQVRVDRVKVSMQCSSFFLLGKPGAPSAGGAKLPGGA